MNPEKLPSYPPAQFHPPKPSLPTRQNVRKWVWGIVAAVAILTVWGSLLFFSKPKIIIATNVPGAQVFIDGEAVGTTNPQNAQLTIPRVNTGRRAVRILHPDYLPAEREIEVKFSFSPATFTFKMNPAAYPLSIRTTPTLSKVLIDGEVAGETDFVSGTLDLPKIKRGPHVLLVQHPGFDDYTTQFVMPDGAHSLNVQMMTTVAGFWSGSWRETEKGKTAETIYNFALDLKQVGTTVTGTWEELPAQVGKAGSAPKQPKSFSVTGSIIGKQLVLEKKTEKGKPIKFEARVADSGREFTGNFANEKSTGTWFAARMDTKPVLNPPLSTATLPPANGFPPALPGPRLETPQNPGFPPVGGAPPTVTDPLAQAKELYEQRQYQAALKICEGILKTDPKNQGAKDLRTRIRKTIEILNRQTGEGADRKPEATKPQNQ
jgi:hypothetical protein